MRKRNIQLNFRVTEAEHERIRLRMQQADVRNQAAFLRKMSMDGYIVSLDLPDIREMVRLLRISSNNLNQYAKKANQNGSIYEADILDLKTRQEDLWNQTQKILAKLSSIS